MQDQKVLTVTSQWAVTIVAGAILTGLVGGAFGAFTALNADHFTVSANTEDIEELKTTKEDKATIQLIVKNLEENFQRMDGKLDDLIKLHQSPKVR